MRLDRGALLVAVERLSRRDRRLASVIRRHGPPPLWARPVGFPTLLRIILEQQVSLASARALYRRLDVSLQGIAPASILVAGPEGLRQLGVTRQKARYACALAERVLDGTVPLARLWRLSDEDATARLRLVPGIGPWTAAIYLLMALRRPDVWPPGDLALHKALAELEGLDRVPSSDEAERMAERWRPHRAAAARILWHHYLSTRRRTLPRPPSAGPARTRAPAGPAR